MVMNRVAKTIFDAYFDPAWARAYRRKFCGDKKLAAERKLEYRCSVVAEALALALRTSRTQLAVLEYYAEAAIKRYKANGSRDTWQPEWIAWDAYRFFLDAIAHHAYSCGLDSKRGAELAQFTARKIIPESSKELRGIPPEVNVRLEFEGRA